MKLSIAQMILGVLIVINYTAGLSQLPAMRLILLPCFHVSVVLGLAAVGCGIAQYLKVRGRP